MHAIVAILKKAAVSMKGDGMPLDIETVPRECFWDVLRFATREYPNPSSDARQKKSWKQDTEGQPVLIVAAPRIDR